RLEEAGISEETRLEFRRLEDREQPPREFDPDSYLRIRKARELSAPELAILRELCVMRDRQAQRVDRPPFKVIANETMLRISRARPGNRGDLTRVKGVTPYVLRRYGELILRAVDRGRKRGRPPPRRSKKPRGERLSPRRQRLMDKLKDWRKLEAAKRGVPTIVVLTNQGVTDIVRSLPQDAQSIAELPSVGKKRARLYGREILGVLSDKAS
ncbi:MAG: HRDC domain-containing protein, partial [Planctomycetota bacterium]